MMLISMTTCWMHAKLMEKCAVPPLMDNPCIIANLMDYNAIFSLS